MKYLAIAFGLVLALGIISSIVNGGVALLRGFGFIDNRPPITEQNSHSFKQDFSGKLESVLIKFDAGSITLQSGDTFQVEGTNIPASLTATLDNSKLVIEDQENTNILPNLIGKDKAPTLVVTIPRDTHLKKMELEIGAGRGELLEIITDELI
ncbi:MAG TPA: hypothetical protein DCY58_06225, partial [Acetobacterium sp.]|nr:hypothetical protein [Acetobacterium sp.]